METGKYFALLKLPQEIYSLVYFPEEKKNSRLFQFKNSLNGSIFHISFFLSYSSFENKSYNCRWLDICFHPLKLYFLK